MKQLKFKNTNLFIIIVLLFSLKGICQSTQLNSNNIMGTINASGNNASGSSGTVTYSIGQVFYTYIGVSIYNVAQGIQHEELSQDLATKQNIVETKAEITIFPNPTTDYVNINLMGFDFENGPRSYQIFDYQGRLLKQNTITQAETQIDLNDLSASIYILQVYVNNKVFKTFKILKK